MENRVEVDSEDTTVRTEYKIKAGTFEGPMALLIHLLEKNKVDIYDIPIAHITAQYLEYLDGMDIFDIDVASEFLVMATLLLHIKARMLLPHLNPPLEGEDVSDDPRDVLVEKIIEYKRLQKYAKALERVYRDMGRYTFRHTSVMDFKENVLVSYPAQALWNSLQNLVVEIKKEQAVHYVDMDELSLQEHMQKILVVLQNLSQKRIVFQELLTYYNSRKETVIISFLAILELLKQGSIDVVQEGMFTPLYIEARG